MIQPQTNGKKVTTINIYIHIHTNTHTHTYTHMYFAHWNDISIDTAKSPRRGWQAMHLSTECQEFLSYPLLIINNSEETSYN